MIHVLNFPFTRDWGHANTLTQEQEFIWSLLGATLGLNSLQTSCSLPRSSHPFSVAFISSRQLAENISHFSSS